MKIAYISNSILPSKVANSVHVMKMCQALSDLGHEVTLVAPCIPKQELKEVEDIFNFYDVKSTFKIKKLYHPSILGKKLIYAFFIVRTLVSYKPDIVYGRFLFGCSFAALFGYKVTYEAHGPIWRQGFLRGALFKKLIGSKNFLGMVVISSALKKMYLGNYDLPDHLVFVAHDGADVQKSHVKAPLQLSKNLNIGYVGSLYQGRGIEVILELAKKNKEIGFHLIGGSEEEIKRWQSSTSNVHFYGFVTQKQVRQFLGALDILLAPYQPDLQTFNKGESTIEWMSPLKIFEYMAAGKAIVCSDFPVLREVLEDKETVLFCRHDDLKGWNQAIQKLANNENLREELGGLAKVSLEKNYTWRKRASLIIDHVLQSNNI